MAFKLTTKVHVDVHAHTKTFLFCLYFFKKCILIVTHLMVACSMLLLFLSQMQAMVIKYWISYPLNSCFEILLDYLICCACLATVIGTSMLYRDVLRIRQASTSLWLATSNVEFLNVKSTSNLKKRQIWRFTSRSRQINYFLRTNHTLLYPFNHN